MPILLHAVAIDSLDRPRARWQKQDLGIGNNGSCPFAIGREIARHPFAQWNRWRAAHVTQSDGIGWSTLLSLLVEEQHVTVSRQSHGKGPIQPGEVLFSACSGS